MSEPNMTDADIELFRTRVLPVTDVPDDAIHLFCSKADVNHYNLKLAQIRTEEFVSAAVHTGKSANMSERSRESTLRHAQNMKTSETQFIKQPEYSNAEIRDILLLTENNFQLLLLRLLASIRAKEQPTAKRQYILKEALSELRCT